MNWPQRPDWADIWNALTVIAVVAFLYLLFHWGPK
jgi:hypothetical protein